VINSEELKAALVRSSGRRRPRFGPVHHQPARGKETLGVLLDEFCPLKWVALGVAPVRTVGVGVDQLADSQPVWWI